LSQIISFDPDSTIGPVTVSLDGKQAFTGISGCATVTDKDKKLQAEMKGFYENKEWYFTEPTITPIMDRLRKEFKLEDNCDVKEN
jgi:hypothetical protein